MAVYSSIVLSGESAIAWEQARGWNQPGACLNTVWQAYGSYQSVGPGAGQYPNAIDGWNFAEQKHPGDYDPPRGVPVYLDAVDGPRWGGDAVYYAGDVCISLGGGQLLATDWPNSGTIGICTIEQRCNQTARPYLGWCGDFLGYQVAEGDTTMSYEEYLANEQRAFSYDLRPNGTGTPGQTYEAGPTFFEQFDNLFSRLNDIEGAISGIQTGDIDYDELAAALVRHGVTVMFLQPTS